MKFIFSFLLVFIWLFGLGQSTAYLTQNIGSPTFDLKPLSGWHGGTQINANYQTRKFWQPIYNQYFINADHYSKKIKSAFGGNLILGSQGEGILKYYHAELYISPKINLTEELVLMPSISAAFNHGVLDGTRLTFQVPEPDLMEKTSRSYLGVGAGIGATYKDWFAALDLSYINKPDNSFRESSESRVPRLLTVAAGKVFTFQDWTFTPTIAFKSWGNNSLIRVTASAQYRELYFGAGYEDSGSITGAIGYEYNRWIRLSYSNRRNFRNGLGPNFSQHEISIRIWLNRGENNGKFISNLGLI